MLFFILYKVSISTCSIKQLQYSLKMANAFGGSRISVKPPERGIFPLDHDGECKQNMKVRRFWIVLKNKTNIYEFLAVFKLYIRI